MSVFGFSVVVPPEVVPPVVVPPVVVPPVVPVFPDAAVFCAAVSSVLFVPVLSCVFSDAVLSSDICASASLASAA